jgi:hypothetical protein
VDDPSRLIEVSCPLASPPAAIDDAKPARACVDERLLWHPHFVLRVGGEPVAAVQSLRSGSAAAAQDRLRDARRHVALDAEGVCARLEATVAGSDDRMLVRRLIQLKRDLFNTRLPPPSLVEGLASCLDEELRGRVADLVRAIDSLRALENAHVSSYEADLETEAAALCRAAALPNLRAALRASSLSLHRAICKVEDGGELRRKDRANLYLGLSGFLTRSTLKTSPKSSLTLVVLGTWGEGGAADVALALDDIVIRRDVRLRDSVVERVLRPVLATAALLAPHAIVIANPTIRIVDAQVEWQRIAWSEPPDSQTFGIAATTNRVRLTSGLLAIVTDLASSPHRSWTLGDYADHLHTRFNRGSDDRIAALLDRLMSLDLLILRDGVPAQGDPLAWARSVAASLRPPLADAVAARVDRLDAAQRALATPDAPADAAEAIERALDDLAAATTAPVRAEQLRPVYHEDCIIASPAIRLGPDAIGELRPDLVDLLMLLPLLRGFGWAGAWLTRHFVARFGVGGCCDDPVDFLAATAELMVSPGADASALPPWQTGSVPDAADAVALDAVSASFADALRDHNTGAGAWTIPAALIHRFYARIPATYRRRARSHCINGQFLTGSDAGRLVVNAVYPGNARMTSRFLEQGDAVSAYIARLIPGRPVAIPGVFGFNANRHPRLCDAEVAISPYPTDFADTAIFPIDACRLRHDPRRNQLVLEDANGGRLSPFYFGILNSWALPPVHRVLDWTNGGSDLPFSIGSGVFARERPAAPPPVYVRPRLTLGKLVLARRMHVVAVDALPDPTLADAAFHAALRNVWHAHELPAQAFFQASNAHQQRIEGDIRPAKTRKPMYLDTDSVWLVKAFQRSLRTLRGNVSITEVLPAPGDTPVTIAGAAHTSEMTIELGLRESDV